MKLKKIASLMLAGVMAVSMLAGCSGKTEEKPGDENTNVAPVTGAAAIVNSELNANKDKISFTDDSVIANVVANYFKENPVKPGEWNGAASGSATTTTWYSDLRDTINSMVGAKGQMTKGFASNGSNEGTYANMYVLSTKFLTKEDALRMVAKDLDGLDLPKEGKVGSGVTVANKDFSYTGTISAVEAESKGGTESVWVIVATMTQTSADK